MAGDQDSARQQIAAISRVADDLDRILDRLTTTVAGLKVILARSSADTSEERQ